MQKIRDTETLDVDQKVTDFAQTLFAKISSNGAGKGNLNLAPNEHQILGRFHSKLLKGIEN